MYAIKILGNGCLMVSNQNLKNFINVLVETDFRNIVVWLEDQKIRHYKIEDRTSLRNTQSSDWPEILKRVIENSLF